MAKRWGVRACMLHACMKYIIHVFFTVSRQELGGEGKVPVPGEELCAPAGAGALPAPHPNLAT